MENIYKKDVKLKNKHENRKYKLVSYWLDINYCLDIKNQYMEGKIGLVFGSLLDIFLICIRLKMLKKEPWNLVR